MTRRVRRMKPGRLAAFVTARLDGPVRAAVAARARRVDRQRRLPTGDPGRSGGAAGGPLGAIGLSYK